MCVHVLSVLWAYRAASTVGTRTYTHTMHTHVEGLDWYMFVTGSHTGLRVQRQKMAMNSGNFFPLLAAHRNSFLSGGKWWYDCLSLLPPLSPPSSHMRTPSAHASSAHQSSMPAAPAQDQSMVDYSLPTTYCYDATTGFYYDSATGLYYDPKTQVHFVWLDIVACVLCLWVHCACVMKVGLWNYAG